MTDEESVVKTLRETINKFKAPYLSEHYGGCKVQMGGDHSIQDIKEEMNDVRNHIDNLYQIIMEVIKANGVVPSTTDMTKKAVYAVFEKNGVFPALRANPSLGSILAHYATQDMRTYPYTFNAAHIDNLAKKRVVPIDIIIPNKE